MNPKVTTSTDLADLEDALARWGSSRLPNPVREKQDGHVLQEPRQERRPWGKPVNYLSGPEFARWDES